MFWGFDILGRISGMKSLVILVPHYGCGTKNISVEIFINIYYLIFNFILLLKCFIFAVGLIQSIYQQSDHYPKTLIVINDPPPPLPPPLDPLCV